MHYIAQKAEHMRDLKSTALGMGSMHMAITLIDQPKLLVERAHGMLDREDGTVQGLHVEQRMQRRYTGSRTVIQYSR